MVLRFYPTKDATIYERYPDKNTGLDSILELSKIVDNTSSYNSRILLDFNAQAIADTLSEYSQDPTRGMDWKLKLYSTEEQEIPLDYTLECKVLYLGWDMGVGRFSNLPETTQGVSWRNRHGKVDPDPSNSWFETYGGSVPVSQSGAWSFNMVEGGGYWETHSISSQSFSYKAADISMDVTETIKLYFEKWNTNGETEGLIIKNTSETENSILNFKSVKFFSKDTHTIYSPVLEARWRDDSQNTNLPEINLSIDGGYNIVSTNLESDYKESSTPRIGFSARPRYPAPTFATSSAYLDRYALPEGTMYAIYSAHTDDVIIDFYDPETKLSVDNYTNYFELPLMGFQPERYYRILLKVPSRNVGYTIHDNDWIFKVSRNQ